MRTRKAQGFPAQLEGARRRFERWRERCTSRSRIPDRLWAAAVKMAGVYGVCQTAKALRVEYYSLKERVEQSKAAASGRPKESPLATFLELPSAVPLGGCECLLEWEEADGTKRRVHVKGIPTPDLHALNRSFWDQRP